MSEHEWPTLGYSVKGNRYEIKATRGEIYEAYTDEQIIELVDRRALAAKDALIAELEQGNRFTLMPGESLQKKTDINGRVIILCIMAANGEPVSDGVAKLVVLDRQQQAEPLIDTSAWQSCNPDCDPEFNGEKGRHCVCDPAKAAMSAKKANSINPEMVDVVGYTTAGMLRISKDLPLTGRIGAKCKPDERWNVPLMTVAQHERILDSERGVLLSQCRDWRVKFMNMEAAKDAEIARLTEERDAHMEVARDRLVRLQQAKSDMRAQPARQVGGGAKRWALSLYNDCGGYSPKMVDPETLPNPETRTRYVLESDYLAALDPAAVDQWAPSEHEYDHSIHHNPDAKAWADLFVATFPRLADKHDLMLGWFANAMMAMHDWLKSEGADPAAVVMPERESVRDAIAQALGDAYDCIRVWSAWEVGTMGPDDFVPVADQEDRLAELVDAAFSEFARLNRRAIPVGLLERIAADQRNTSLYSAEKFHEALNELRALLGKEGE